MSGDRLIVLRPEDPVSFLADACASAADAVNEIRAWRPSDSSLARVYAELVLAYARVEVCERTGVKLAIMKHLMERVDQALAGEVTPPLTDIVDRLHAEVAAGLVPG